jgi:hypothetical protein
VSDKQTEFSFIATIDAILDGNMRREKNRVNFKRNSLMRVR